jgi:hypothetical protein
VQYPGSGTHVACLTPDVAGLLEAGEPSDRASARRDVGNPDRRTICERIGECVHAGCDSRLMAGPDSCREGGRHDSVSVPALRAMAIDDHAVVAAIGLQG